MANKKAPINVPAVIITAFAVVLAAAAVIFLVFTMSKNNGSANVTPNVSTDAAGNPVGSNSFTASQELLTEVETAAYELLPKNYKIYQYFTKGMSYKEEPYGNLPEDGFYTCVNDEYKTFDQFCAFIRATFTEKTSSTLISNPFGYGPVYGDDNGELGLSSKFEEAEDSGLSWEDTKFVCTPSSETECKIEITLKDKDGKDIVKQVKMLKENNVWLLDEMVG